MGSVPAAICPAIVSVATRMPSGPRSTPSIVKALAGQGFKSSVVAHGAALGTGVQVVERNPADRGFVPRPKRWVAEQTLGTLSFHRRLVRDYELPRHRGNSYYPESRVIPSWRSSGLCGGVGWLSLFGIIRRCCRVVIGVSPLSGGGEASGREDEDVRS
jgi:hypothetical protein